MKPKLNPNQYQELERSIRKLDGGIHGVFYDGAIDLDRYSLSNRRILWILKEAVGDYIANRYDNQLIDSNITNRSFCPTLRVVANTSYGILMHKNLKSEIPDLYNGPAEILREIAIINVKKAMGETSSPNGRILQAYKENKDLLLKQIRYYDPDIIIFGFPESCSEIIYDIIGPDARKHGHQIGDCACFTTSQRLFIWTYHPAKPGNGAKYIEEILSKGSVP